ncbi:MAG: GIY-YIG nuclease family protein [Bacteroidetes bacterium]|nr:GIY-YIG nuclease family protein [Bacteroidota bacterium]
MFYAYVLRSESTKTHYYGSTEDLGKRLNEHNSGKVKYTKGRRPWALHYFEEYQTRAEATRRERFFKSISGYLYLKEKGII